ncbi:MAG: SDR family NAD(P)-dependent oxidoreductase [Acidobacteriia bacterium]|nr:SDR family NAD(P)-dependent oxidoreductase [Terriglobia bacterium]
MSLDGKKVLITGAEGFIGSHLVESLVQEGARVVALCQYNSFNHWGWLEELPCISQIEVISGDIRDSHFCIGLMKGVEVVYHLAALIPIPYSYRAPESYFDTNVKGTLNLCQAAVRNGVQRFIHTSTSEVYGTAQYVPIDEHHPVVAQSPYSASKIAADAVALSFHYSFDLPVVIARPFNTYGPRQSARAIIPTIITQMAAKSSEIRLGDLEPTRDFTFVTDTSEALRALARMEGGLGEVFQIGSNREIRLCEVFEILAELMCSDAQPSRDPDRIRPARSEVRRLWCDNTKLKKATGFTPSTLLRDGLATTVDWFIRPENLMRYKPHVYNC